MCNYFLISITTFKKRHLKKRTVALDPLPPSPPPPQRTLCTLVKMMTIMDDPLLHHILHNPLGPWDDAYHPKLVCAFIYQHSGMHQW